MAHDHRIVCRLGVLRRRLVSNPPSSPAADLTPHVDQFHSGQGNSSEVSKTKVFKTDLNDHPEGLATVDPD
jgi:hypothetical protein